MRDEIKMRYESKEYLFFAVIIENSESIVTKKWTTSRFTWSEGTQEFEHEEGIRKEYLSISIYSIDERSTTFYKEHSTELNEWLFKSTFELYDSNLPSKIWVHIKHRERFGPAVFEIKSCKTIVTIRNAENEECIKQLFPRYQLVDRIVQQTEKPFKNTY